MIVKNIYGQRIEILGVGFNEDQERPLSDFGDAAYIKKNQNDILEAIKAEALQMLYSDGKVESDINIIIDILNGTNTPSVTEQDASGRYYYLRDTFQVKKDEPVLKKFIGRVYRIAITPWGDTKFGAKTESGLILPEDGLPPSETFELKPELGSDINEIYLATDKDYVWVTVIMDGYTNEPNEVLQPFINNWREDSK